MTGILENFRVAEDMPIESDLVTQALDKVSICTLALHHSHEI